MSVMTFNPQNQLGAASQGITGLPVIIGLPSSVDPVPHFVVGVTTRERANTSSMLTGMPITDGDLVMKSARNPGNYTFDLVLSETPATKSQQVESITRTVQQIANVASTLFSGSSPSLSGLTAGVVASQLISLRNMKDAFQPIFALNLFTPLSALSISSSYLESTWYIESMVMQKEEAERGLIVTITLKELLSKKDFGISSIIRNLANELLGPGVGGVVG